MINESIENDSLASRDWNVNGAEKAMNQPECLLSTLDGPREDKSAERPSITAAKHPKTTYAAVAEPKWTLSKLFSSDTGRLNALATNQRAASANDLRCPDLFKYGLCFNPDKDQRDVYRTVTMSGLPAVIANSAILSQVKGGAVVDFTLLDTIKIIGSNTALITFLHEHSAMAYEEHAKEHQILFDGSAAQVTLLTTPTWPIRPKLRKAIFDHQHTRCIEVYNFPRTVSPAKLRSDLRICAELKSDRIVYMGKRKDGILELQFASIDWAGHAFGLLSKFWIYRECTPYFVPDPCAEPLETLLKQPNGKLCVINAAPATPSHNIGRELTAIGLEVEYNAPNKACCVPLDNIDTQLTTPGNMAGCSAVNEVFPEPSANVDAELITVNEEAGRLGKIEWEGDLESTRGRGIVEDE